ncbi:MAG: GNAT family N-acetyltransferase [Candidatus Lokiarchaeota archaeon]|nr:GNAT family N-acetyltransferase [Candidatus Lokiarchaeota archaeon]
MNNLIRLTRKHIKPAVKTLTRAFYDDPLHIFYFPDTSIRDEKLHNLFKFNVSYSLRYGEAYSTSLNFEGVALWQLIDPNKKARFKFSINYESFLVFQLVRRVGKEAANRILCYNFVLRTHHELVPYRHWYFFNIGVDPNFQGKGYASNLIKPMLGRIEKEHLSCYLDTNDEKKIALYQHYGFKVLKKYQIPEIEITNWSMLRENPL